MKMHFDTSSKAFSAEIRLNTTINSPTVIFAHESFHYPKGFKLQLLLDNVEIKQGSPHIKVNSKPNFKSVQVTDPQYDGKILKIKINK